VIANAGVAPRTVVELSTLAVADKLRFERILAKAGHIALNRPLRGTGAQPKIEISWCMPAATAMPLRDVRAYSPILLSREPILADMEMAAG
jgi:hypothetical protein